MLIICFFQHFYTLYIFRCLYIILRQFLVMYANKMKTSIEGVVTKNHWTQITKTS
jgi:diacylglycerol kinase